MAWHAQVHGMENVEPEMLHAVHEGVQSGMEILGAKGAELVQNDITTPYQGKPPAVFTGNLAASIVSLFQWMGDAAHEIVGVSPSLHADRYAAPVETGARPHMPPVDALIPWVQKKFDIDDEKQALSMAWAVAKSMAKSGTDGHRMFGRALIELEPLAAPTLEAAIARTFAQYGFKEGIL